MTMDKKSGNICEQNEDEVNLNLGNEGTVRYERKLFKTFRNIRRKYLSEGRLDLTGNPDDDVIASLQKDRANRNVDIRQRKRTLKFNVLPLIVIVLLVLLFVSGYVLYTMIKKEAELNNINNGVEHDFVDVKSIYSYPGCGKRMCTG